MHIIKISSASFKIILTKEDVEKYSKKYVSDDKIDSYGFFCEIKDKTDSLFDYPFDALSVSAEFFQSKDGGGELFLTAKQKPCIHNYCFKTQSSDMLFKMCNSIGKRMKDFESKLYFYNNLYHIILCFENTPDEFLIALMSEYGEISKCLPILEWHLSEHAKCIFNVDAIERIITNLA